MCFEMMSGNGVQRKSSWISCSGKRRRWSDRGNDDGEVLCGSDYARALESLGSPGSKDGRLFCVRRGWDEMKLRYGYLGKEVGDHEEFSA
jgi:hypothetical protein